MNVFFYICRSGPGPRVGEKHLFAVKAETNLEAYSKLAQAISPANMLIESEMQIDWESCENVAMIG